MGIYPQLKRWLCGPFALKYALLVLGVSADETEIAKIAGTRRDRGTDDGQLRRAARAYRCGLPLVRRLDEERARRSLNSHLRRGIPVLICLYEWHHWVTIVKAERGRFICLDSDDPLVIGDHTWPELKRSWCYHQKDEFDSEEVHRLYDLHPVVPRFRVQRRAMFSLARVRYLRRAENRIIAHRWDEYVADLLDLCKVRTPLSEKVMSMGEFLRRHEGMILDQVVHWHGATERRHAARILAHLRFVADTLGMIIPEREEKKAIASLSSLLTLWAEGEATSNPLYSPPRPRPRR